MNDMVENQTENTEATVEESADQENTPVKSAPAESDAEKNFRELREKTKRIERERDEAMRILQTMQEQQKSQETQPVEEDDDVNLGPDELAEGKHLSKVGRKIKKLEEQLRNYQKASVESSAEARVKSQFHDFDKVVSQDNIALLKEMHPEIAATLNSNPDLYTKAASAYKMIKNLGIYKEDVFKSERDVAQSNLNKPRPLTSVSPQQGDSPLSRANAFANGLTPELKAQLLKEMNDARMRM